jgi:hypothetical protein
MVADPVPLVTDHVPPAVASVKAGDAEFIHTEDAPPPIGATVGKALIVTVAVLVHPLLSLYVIVAEPAATPVTNPDDDTVAIEVFEEVHGLEAAGVPEPVSCVVALTHALKVPLIVGEAFTVTVAFALHPETV